MYSTLSARLESIRNLPINQIADRQPMLVRLMADIVNYETENGKLTKQKPLEMQSYWTSLNELTKAAGFIKLGNGHFSVAYKHPMLPGKVLKVGLKKEDSGAAYVAFCRMHAGREGIPVIHDVQRFEGCYIVVLDELLPVGYDEWYQHGSQAICDAVHDSQFNLEDYSRKPSTEFLETCRLIHEFFKGIAKFDMHPGNVMIDPKTGKLIITDPVSFTKEPEDVPLVTFEAIKGQERKFLHDIERIAERERLRLAIRAEDKRVRELVLVDAEPVVHEWVKITQPISHDVLKAQFRASLMINPKGIHESLIEKLGIKEFHAQQFQAEILKDRIRIAHGLPLYVDQKLQRYFRG